MLTAQTYYLVPWQNPMDAEARRGRADRRRIVRDPLRSGPAAPYRSSAPQSYPVNVVELDATPGSQTVTAYVDVSAP